MLLLLLIMMICLHLTSVCSVTQGTLTLRTCLSPQEKPLCMMPNSFSFVRKIEHVLKKDGEEITGKKGVLFLLLMSLPAFQKDGAYTLNVRWSLVYCIVLLQQIPTHCLTQGKAPLFPSVLSSSLRLHLSPLSVVH